MNFVFGYQSDNVEEPNEFMFRAKINKVQFKALGHHLGKADLENEILNNKYYLDKLSLAANHSNIEMVQWLKNSWNTESVLAQNLKIVENTNQAFCMQWAFPQAYYAVFGNILALFKAIGCTESSHTAVLKKYAKMMIEKKLPETISICCTGTKRNLSYHNIDGIVQDTGPFELNLGSTDSINNQLRTFLRSTRELRLKEKAIAMNFKTQKGEKRKKLSDGHWIQVSEKLGPTSMIDFLYRKRIKGNYQDIDTYNSPEFDGISVLNDLICIIDRINLVNESYISKVIEFDTYQAMVTTQLHKVKNEKLSNRIKTIEEIENAQSSNWN